MRTGAHQKPMTLCQLKSRARAVAVRLKNRIAFTCCGSHLVRPPEEQSRDGEREKRQVGRPGQRTARVAVLAAEAQPAVAGLPWCGRTAARRPILRRGRRRCRGSRTASRRGRSRRPRRPTDRGRAPASPAGRPAGWPAQPRAPATARAAASPRARRTAPSRSTWLRIWGLNASSGAGRRHHQDDEARGDAGGQVQPEQRRCEMLSYRGSWKKAATDPPSGAAGCGRRP